MKRTLITLTVALFTLTSVASARRPVHHKNAAKIKLNVASCGFYGTPVEFPNDVQITNKGRNTLKKGTRIQWRNGNGAHKGVYKLTSDLAAGATVSAHNVVPGGIPAGASCTAKVLRRRVIDQAAKPRRVRR
ncbi:MAG: hypothetical protein ACE366_04400 [Bradymonadia bacterium]